MSYLLRFAALAVCVLTLSLSADVARAQRPNFVVFLVDDLGYMDIGANNPETFYETPNVDRLARQGMRFTQGYAASPVCSPTRFSVMTGRYPTRVAATDWFAGKRAGRFLPAPLNDCMPRSERTLGEALLAHGYRTAFVGKWHLGPSPPFWPESRGFQINIGGHDRGSPPGGYFAPFKNPRLEDGPEGQHLTERLTDEALQILEKFAEEPFLLVFSFYTVHTPLQAPQQLVEKYQQKAQGVPADGEFQEEEQIWPDGGPRRVRSVQRHATYAAMVETMDTSVGRVLDKLEQLGLSDDTVVLFTSDNGGLSTSEGSPTSNLPLRGGKGWLYEGGTRVPLIIKWPGITPPGSVSETPVMSIDFYPTILEIAGQETDQSPVLDGVSLTPILEQRAALPERALFWHYPHYSNQGGFPGGAVRVGNYKLLERYEDGRAQLYDLASDLSEQRDLAETQPDKVHELRAQLHAWYDQVGAQFLQARENGPQPWRNEE
jgi:arylsulfatase A-like enzyme